MAIYEKFIAKPREAFTSLEDVRKNLGLHWDEDFNFAYDVIDVLGTEKPDKLAMVWVSAQGEEKYFTFKDIMTESSRAANYLYSLGIRKGDPVMLVLKRSYWFWFVLLGLHKIGAVAIQSTDMLMPRDYIYRCNSAEIKAVIITGDGESTAQFDKAAPECPTVRHKFVTKHKQAGEGWIDFEDGFAAASADWARPEGDEATKVGDVMMLAFSSGTTGYPKMILHDFTYPLGHLVTGVFWHRVIDGGLHFTISDTGWLKSLWGKLYGQWLGESAVFTYDFDKFDGADILQKMDKYKVTTFCVPPTMYRLILQNDLSKYDLSSLKHCCTAGEALNPQIFNEWKQCTGLEIFEGFGQTETTLCLATLYPFTKPVPGCIGLSVPGYDVRIMDADGHECEPGVTGEICILYESFEKRPRGLMQCYYKNDDSNKESFAGGYYHTGDTAFRDENGYVNYIGRNDDLIKSSGYRIGPFEVESVLLEHPSVLEVAVTGVPDPVRGFNVKATIVLKPGFEASDALVKELQNFVKTNTAPYKYPRVVEFVEKLPKTFNGKIKRVEIRQKDMQK
ncbi:MAG: AMP-binding protein [Oscillospiraceae bacterium]|nr:AMP-binding protein [Oscillospiraceae bacterium]